MAHRQLAVVLAIAASITALGCASRQVTSPTKTLTMTEILAATTADDWRPNSPDNTLYLEIPSGRVIMELAPNFAPRHVANIKALVAAKYFDGLAITRVQDNFVAQWGDAENARPTAPAARNLAPEFDRADGPDLPFTTLLDADGYAPTVGFSGGFPAARDGRTRRAWLTHCYATLGVGRDMAADSGSGTELYVVIGHAPRQLDRNVTVVGRVLRGIELLASLPRGTGAMGFYDPPSERIPIRSVRLASDLPSEARTPLEVLRTDTPSFQALSESRRNRHDAWYLHQSDHIDLCNVPIPVRDATAVALH